MKSGKHDRLLLVAIFATLAALGLTPGCRGVTDSDHPQTRSAPSLVSAVRAEPPALHGVYQGTYLRVYRVYDREADVVCWISTASKGISQTCLPVHKLALGVAGDVRQ